MVRRRSRASFLDFISARGIGESRTERIQRLTNSFIAMAFLTLTLYVTSRLDLVSAFTDLSAVNVPAIVAVTAGARTILSFCPWRLVRPVLSVLLAVAVCVTVLSLTTDVPRVNPQPQLLWISSLAALASAAFDCWVYRQKARHSQATAVHRGPQAQGS